MGSSTPLRLTAALALAALACSSAPAMQASAKPPVAPAPGAQAATSARAEAYQKYIEAERLEEKGEFVLAVAAYKRAIELAPDDDGPRAALARLYLQYRNVADARATALEAVKSNKGSVQAHLVLAQISVIDAVSGGSLDKEKAKVAVTELEELVKLDPAAEMLFNQQSMKALAVLGSLYMELDQEDKALAAFERLSSVDGSSDTFLAIAQLYFGQNKFREAARSAEQARKLNASSLEVAVLLARSYLRVGRTTDALNVYKESLTSVDEQNRNALRLEYADALVRAGRYADASDAVKPILATDAKNVRAVRITADALRRQGKRDQAVKTLQDALGGQDVSESLELVFYLAETYEEMEQFDKAVATYEEALTSLLNPDGTVSPKDKQNASIVLRRIAVAERLAGHPEKVNANFERMRKVLGADSNLPDLLMIQHALETADYDTALAIARKRSASATGDDRRSFQFAEAQALGKKSDLAGAVKVLESMLKSDADADVYSVMAAVQLDAGDAAAAERSVGKALALEPNDPALLVTLSSVQDKAGRYPEAEATLRKVLAADPDNATALNNLGYFLTERKVRLDEAVQLIQRAINIDPTNGSFLDSLGWLYFQMGRLDEAKKYLEQAAQYERQSSTIREHLGDLYKKLGDAKLARQQWETAVRLANEPDEIARLRGKLKGVGAQ